MGRGCRSGGRETGTASSRAGGRWDILSVTIRESRDGATTDRGQLGHCGDVCHGGGGLVSAVDSLDTYKCKDGRKSKAKGRAGWEDGALEGGFLVAACHHRPPRLSLRTSLSPVAGSGDGVRQARGGGVRMCDDVQDNLTTFS